MDKYNQSTSINMLKLDSNIVTLIGTLGGVVIGSIMAYVIERKNQKRLWIKDYVENLYSPFYEEITLINRQLKIFSNLQTGKWEEISQKASFLKIPEKISKKIKVFYENVVGYNNQRIKDIDDLTKILTDLLFNEYRFSKTDDEINDEFFSDCGCGSRPFCEKNFCIIISNLSKEKSILESNGDLLGEIKSLISQVKREQDRFLGPDIPEEYKNFSVSREEATKLLKQFLIDIDEKKNSEDINLIQHNLLENSEELKKILEKEIKIYS